jgi:hypothetical protein
MSRRRGFCHAILIGVVSTTGCTERTSYGGREFDLQVSELVDAQLVPVGSGCVAPPGLPGVELEESVTLDAALSLRITSTSESFSIRRSDDHRLLFRARLRDSFISLDGGGIGRFAVASPTGRRFEMLLGDGCGGEARQDGGFY